MGILKKLANELDILIMLHREMIGHAKEKRKAIVRGDLELLRAITDAEKALADEVKNAEDRRMKIVEEWMSEKGEDAPRPKLLDIIKQSKGETAEKLAAQRIELLQLIERLSRFNRDNMNMLETSLDYMDTFLRLLTGEDDGDIYEAPVKNGAQKSKKTGARPALVDKRA